MELHQKKFSAGYFHETLNFSIENLPKVKDTKKFIYIELAEKILLRGLPTKFSKNLKISLNKYFPNYKFKPEETLCLINTEVPEWSKKIIKGNPVDKNDNPAYDFYNNLNTYLKDYPFIKQLTLPECEIASFYPEIRNYKNFSKKTHVDFYIPSANLIIEIDGRQHEEDFTQINKDIERKKLFNDIGIKVISIPTLHIRDKDHNFDKSILKIKKHLTNSKLVNNYKNAYLNKDFLNEDCRYIAIGIIRFQIFLIELIKRNVLSLNDKSWKFNVNTDFKSSINWVELAFEDLFSWLLPIANLYDEDILKPKIFINLNGEDFNISSPNEEYINVNVFIHQRYSEVGSSNIFSIYSCYINDYKLEKFKSKILLDYTEIQPVNFSYKNINNIEDKIKKHALIKILNQLYGYDDFKDGQMSILNKVFDKSNTLGLLPTGGGKSLCFQLPSLLQLGCTIVICPIKALMHDHNTELEELGFKRRVRYLTGDQESWERNLILNNLLDKKVQFLFVTPERFQMPGFRKILQDLAKNKLLANIVIDEVHCLSEWGHDFRPSYLALTHTIFSILKLKVPIISLTATASLSVLKDLKIELNLKEEDIIYRMHNGRKELNYNIAEPNKIEEKKFTVTDGNNKQKHLNEIISSFMKKGMPSANKAGIIFTPHVNGEYGCYDVMLNIKNSFPQIKMGIFPGNEPKKWKGEEISLYKKMVQNEFKNNNLDLIAATKAFGMGINKKNIRFTIHYGMPSSMEALYQEAGRSGRDGKRADCIVIFSKEPEPIPESIHNLDTKIEGLQNFSKGFDKGDFGRQIYLMTSKKDSLKKEFNECMDIIKIIKKSNLDKITINKVKELHLYRLFQLGIIDDWSVKDFFNNGSYELTVSKIKEIDIEKKLILHIKKYVLNKQELLKHIEKIKSESKNDNKNKLSYYLKYLLKWNYDNFVYTRRQALKTLYDHCINFKDIGPKKFKMSIDEYFKVDTQTFNIGKYVETEAFLCPNYLDELFTNNLGNIDITSVEKLQFPLSRYLESFQNNPWLDLVSGISRLITGKFNDVDGKKRLEGYVTNVKNDPKNWNNFLINLFKFVAKLEKNHKEIFSETMESYLNGINELKLMHNYLVDDHSALVFLGKMNNRLNKAI